MSKNLDLPKHWEVKKLGEVASYINGRAFKPTEWSRTGFPIIRIQNLNREVSEYNYCNFSVDEKYYVNKGDLLFAWSGTPDTSFGAHIWKGEKAVLNQHIFRIVIDEKIILKSYYLHALNHKVKEFVSKAHGTAGLAHITKKKFEEAQIFLPPLPEQAAIVSKIEELLSDLDNGKQQLLAAQQQLKVYRQSLLKAAFEGKLTEEWRRSRVRVPSESQDKTTLKVHGSRVRIPSKSHTEELMAAEPEVEYVPKVGIEPHKEATEGRFELPHLPEGWRWVKFGELFYDTPQNGLYKPSSQYGSGTAILRIDGFYDGVIVHNYEYKKVRLTKEETKKYLLAVDDIVVNRVNSMSHLGKCGLVKSLKEQTVFESNVMKIQVNKDLAQPKFVTSFLSSSKGLKELTKNAKHAVNQASINQTDVSNAIIPLPPLKEQQAIVDELESKLTVCDKIEETISNSLQQAETLKQSILKRAFEGRLV